MAAPQTAYERLTEFVSQRTGWYKPADPRTENVRARKHLGFTGTRGFFLIIIAVQHPIDATKTEWQGLVKPEFRTSPETPDEIFQGTFEDCATWLDRKERALVKQHEQEQWLRDFAEGRRGWQFHDGGKRTVFAGTQVAVYASRIFDYGKHGQVLLSVQPNHAPRAPFTAQVNLQFSAGPEASCAESAEGVQEWVDDWEACLALPLRLAECKTDAGGREMAAKATRAHLGRLAYLLEIDGTQDEIRRWLLNTFVPASVRSRG